MTFETNDGAEDAPVASRKRRGRPARTAGDQRWETILKASADVFFAKGYEAATVRDVAEAAGMLSGSLYYYIESKEDLLFALTEQVHIDALKILEDPDLTTGSATERLRRFLEAWLTRLQRDRQWSLLVEREFRTLREDRRRTIIQYRRVLEEALRDIIELGLHENEFTAGTDPTVAVNTVLQIFNYTPVWFNPDGRLSLRQIGEWQIEFVIRGLTTPRP